MFHRTDIQPLDHSFSTSVETLTISGSLAPFPNLHHVSNTICCLGFDVTDSHLFGEETFKPHICVSPEDFQLGVDDIRLYRHSWRHRSTDGQNVWTIPTEVKIRIEQVSDIVQARRRDFGDPYLDICKTRKKISLARQQLRVVSSLSEQGVAEWSERYENESFPIIIGFGPRKDAEERLVY